METKKNSSLVRTVLIVQFLIIGGLIAFILYKKTDLFEVENTFVSSSEYIFGIDVSHHQGKINWEEVRTSHHPIEYVFIRATMGTNGKDKEYAYNWNKVKKHGYIRGAYHYYRPNEDATLQFENFKATVSLSNGDFAPVLDIEKESKLGREKLREGVLTWLKLAEEEYGVKPIIYTGLKFYKHILEGYVDGYPLWIAAYSGKGRLKGVNWDFHQFTEKVRVKGIDVSVDGNDYRNDLEDLNSLRILN